MRLLIVSTVSATVKAFLLPYADYFRSKGWKVDALAHGIGYDQTSAQHFDEVHDIEWSRDPLDYRNPVRAIREVRRVVAAGGYDIVHVHTPVAAFITRLGLAQGAGDRRPQVIYTAHGFHFHPGGNWLKNSVFKVLERTAGRWTSYLITINRTDQCEASRLHLVPADRLLYMPGIGVDRDRFRPGLIPDTEIEALRRGFGLRENDPAFVMIAEFNPRKRHADAVAALTLMRNKVANVIFVGDGPQRRAIERLAKDSGVSERVHFAGAQDDVRPFIMAARATILPSTQEGLPRSVMESLSCGVPVIGSDIRGTRDLLSDGGGLLFPVGDAAVLASRLDWFADHPEEAGAMGATARKLTENYDIARLLALHEKLYAKAEAESSLLDRQ